MSNPRPRRKKRTSPGEEAPVDGGGAHTDDAGNGDPTASPVTGMEAASLRVDPEVEEALRALLEEDADGAPSREAPAPGSVASEDEKQRLLAAASAYAETREATYRVTSESRRPGRFKVGIALAVASIATAIAMWPPDVIVPDPYRTLTDAERVQGVHEMLWLQAQQVEAYRLREGRLPRSLAELPSRFSGVALVTAGNRVYQLVAYGPDRRAVVYDSAVPSDRFESVNRRWAARQNSP